MRNTWSRVRNLVAGIVVAKAIVVGYGANTVKATGYGQLCCERCAGKSYSMCCSDDWCGEAEGSVSCSSGGCGVECNDGTYYWNSCD